MVIMVCISIRINPQSKELNINSACLKPWYEEIAVREGTTVQTVGQRRALQLRDLANPGDWVQNDAGKWYRK
jgi:uncharacterized protein YdbL (DUF1318 family)